MGNIACIVLYIIIYYCTELCIQLYNKQHTYCIINSWNGADFLKVPVWVDGVLDGVSLTVGGLMVEEELGIDILLVQSHTSYNKITASWTTFLAVIVTCSITQSDSGTAFTLGIVRGIITIFLKHFFL